MQTTIAYRKIKKLASPINVMVQLLDAYQDKTNTFLLESSEGYDKFSYFGFDPYLILEGYEAYTQLRYFDNSEEKIAKNLFEVIKEVTKNINFKEKEDEKYLSPLIGFLTYECIQFIEEVKFEHPRELQLPLSIVQLPRTVIIYDDQAHEYTLIRNVYDEEILDHTKLEEELAELEARIIELTKQTFPPLQTKLKDREMFTSMSHEEFLGKAKRCKEYIQEGDIFQVQLSRRVGIPTEESSVAIYRTLKRINPSPYMFYLNYQEFTLVGASPELLVKIEDRKMELYPIAGTRKRPIETEKEEAVIYDLLNDEKEQAEHIMLVDLARHEVGKVCQYGSVEVIELMEIEKFSHVIHMVSKVVGTLKDDQDEIDALQSSFPAGTVTGAPKIRAIEIIEELETVQREFYAGGILLMDFSGNLKSSIAIRSICIKDQIAYTQAAAGMVYDSIPENEYQETVNKMKACVTALHEGEETQ